MKHGVVTTYNGELQINILFEVVHTSPCVHSSYRMTVFRLDALALSVIATATWLAGWLSHSGIVSKRLNLSENFFDRLKAPSF